MNESFQYRHSGNLIFELSVVMHIIKSTHTTQIALFTIEEGHSEHSDSLYKAVPDLVQRCFQIFTLF